VTVTASGTAKLVLEAAISLVEPSGDRSRVAAVFDLSRITAADERRVRDVLQLAIWHVDAVTNTALPVLETWQQAVLRVARSQVGEAENPVGSNKTLYGEWYGSAAGQRWNGQAWCGMFVSWCFFQAGTPLPELQAAHYSGFASAQIGQDACRKRGWLVSQPEPGDIVFFDWTRDGHAEHVGIVVAVEAGRVETIEGNTGNPAAYVQRRARDMSVCSAFARPRF